MDIQKVISKNLVRYRVDAKITQAQLAEKINYSDKSISKWERGEGLPDVQVLVQLANLYGVTLNDFVVEEPTKKVNQPKTTKISHKFIALLSSILVWLVATVVFVGLFLIPSTQSICWLSFVYAIPANAIVLLVFSCLWGNEIERMVCSSVILWGTVLSICLSAIANKTVWILCTVGIVFQVLIVVWYIFLIFKKKNKHFRLFNNQIVEE